MKLSTTASYAVVGVLLLGAVVLGVLESRGAAMVRKGEPAPEFVLPKFGGGKVALSELRGQLVLIDFWATWCPPCVKELPWLTKVAKDYESKGVRFVAVNSDDDDQPAVVGLFLDQRAPDLKPYVVLGDARVKMQYQVQALPTMYLVDREGKIIESERGMTSERAVRAWLDEALEKQHASR